MTQEKLFLNSEFDLISNPELLEKLPVTVEIRVDSLNDKRDYLTEAIDWLYSELGDESLDTWAITFDRMKTADEYVKIITVFLKDEETAVLFKTSCL